MKIATLALNPVLDKTMYFGDDVKFGELNRAVAPSVTTVGGKGTNVACVLKSLGIESTAYGFVGGHNGEIFEKLLGPYGIHTDFVKTKCETRENIKIITRGGVATEFNEAGGPVEPSELAALMGKIGEALKETDLFFMGGSVPVGIKKDIYKVVMDMGTNTRFVIDCDGEALKLGMAGPKRPFAIKPNQYELEQFCGRRFEAGLDEIKGEIKKIYDETGVVVLCSLGEYGAIYCGEKGIFYQNAPKVELKGFTGAGDTLLSVFIAGCFGLFDVPRKTKSLESDALAFAVAAASAKVQKPGTEFASFPEMTEMYEKTK